MIEYIDIDPAVFMEIVSGFSRLPDGKMRANGTAIAAMCRVTDEFRGIEKESNEKTRVKNPKKHKRSKVNDRIRKKMVLELMDEPDISESELSERIGLHRSTINGNPELHAIYERHHKSRIVEHKFDNEKKRI